MKAAAVKSVAGTAMQVTDAFLRSWPLPQPDPAGDKTERGHTLVIAGSREMPGAAWLASQAVLRAGAGKLAVATSASIAPGLALLLPEARVIALPENEQGGLDASGVALLESTLAKIDAVLVGPGLLDEAATCRFVQALLKLTGDAEVVLDALAMNVVSLQPRFERPVLMTPHAGEMAHLSGAAKDDVGTHAAELGATKAAAWNAVVALKGACTRIASPSGEAWEHDGGQIGLATSGSGDVLAGIVTGLVARGAPLAQAAVWGVALHGRAGAALATRHGPIGYLASELAAEIPRLMHDLRPAP